MVTWVVWQHVAEADDKRSSRSKIQESSGLAAICFCSNFVQSGVRQRLALFLNLAQVPTWDSINLASYVGTI